LRQRLCWKQNKADKDDREREPRRQEKKIERVRWFHASARSRLERRDDRESGTGRIGARRDGSRGKGARGQLCRPGDGAGKRDRIIERIVVGSAFRSDGNVGGDRGSWRKRERGGIDGEEKVGPDVEASCSLLIGIHGEKTLIVEPRGGAGASPSREHRASVGIRGNVRLRAGWQAYRAHIAAIEIAEVTGGVRHGAGTCARFSDGQGEHGIHPGGMRRAVIGCVRIGFRGGNVCTVGRGSGRIGDNDDGGRDAVARNEFFKGAGEDETGLQAASLGVRGGNEGNPGGHRVFQSKVRRILGAGIDRINGVTQLLGDGDGLGRGGNGNREVGAGGRARV